MDLNSFFEAIKDELSQFDTFKVEVVKNTNEILTFMHNPTNVAFLLEDYKRANAALFLLNFFLKWNSKEDNSTIFVPLIELYSTPETCNRQTAASLYRELFSHLNRYNRYDSGYEFFTKIVKYSNANTFSNTKAYAIYFAYQIKRYDNVEKILNIFLIELKYESYKEVYDFCMLNFYKGLIFLSKQELYKAVICFSATFQAVPSLNVFTHFHIESMKRIILLSYLVEPIYKNQLSQIISQNKKLMYIKPLEVYNDFNKTFSNKGLSFRDVEKYVKEITPKCRVDKTNGLLKLCLKNFGLAKIQGVLKSYKRIRIDKLSNMIEMDKSTLLSYLKIFSYKNKINVQIDEIEEIIEVKSSYFDERQTIQELKSTFANVNSIQEELINVNFKKAEKSEKMKFQSDEMEMRAMIMEMQGTIGGAGMQGKGKGTKSSQPNADF